MYLHAALTAVADIPGYAICFILADLPAVGRRLTLVRAFPRAHFPCFLFAPTSLLYFLPLPLPSLSLSPSLPFPPTFRALLLRACRSA